MEAGKTLYTTFRDTWENPPEAGHFILIKIEQGMMKYRFQSFTPYQVYVLPVQNQFILQIRDKKGVIREDVHVTMPDKWKVKVQQLIYDSQTRTYITEYQPHLFNMEVELDGIRSYFKVEKNTETKIYPYNPGIKAKGDGKSYLITQQQNYLPGETLSVSKPIYWVINTNPYKIT